MIRPNNPPSPGRGPKRSRSISKGGSPPKKKGCWLLLAWALVIIPLSAYGLWAFALGAGTLLAAGLAAVVGP